MQALSEGCTNAASGAKDEGDCRSAHRPGLLSLSRIKEEREGNGDPDGDPATCHSYSGVTSHTLASV